LDLDSGHKDLDLILRGSDLDLDLDHKDLDSHSKELILGLGLDSKGLRLGLRLGPRFVFDLRDSTTSHH